MCGLRSLVSAEGRHIFAVVQQRRGGLMRYDSDQRAFGLYLGGMSADHVEFSRDARWIAYSSFPETFGEAVVMGVNGYSLAKYTAS